MLNLVCYVSLCECLRAGAGSLRYIVHVDCCGLSTIVIKKIIIIIIIVIIYSPCLYIGDLTRITGLLLTLCALQIYLLTYDDIRRVPKGILQSADCA